MGLPMTEWLYKKCYKIKYGELPPSRDVKEDESQ